MFRVRNFISRNIKQSKHELKNNLIYSIFETKTKIKEFTNSPNIMIKNYILFMVLICNFLTAFSQKKNKPTLNNNISDSTFFASGKYLKLQKKYAKNIFTKDSLNEIKLVDEAKKALLYKRSVKSNLTHRKFFLANIYIDSLIVINPKDPDIYKFYLQIADYHIRKGNIFEGRKSLSLAKKYNASINLNSRNAYLLLQEERAKQIFLNKTIDFLWFDDYATLTKKKIVKKNEAKKIDSLYINQKDSLKYKKWLPAFYIFSGIFKDKFLINSNDNQKYLTSSNYSTQIGCRIFFNPAMSKTSYFADIIYSNRNFQNIDIIENTKYYIEKFSVSSISIPLNVKYNLNNSAKHLYTSFGIAPSYFFRMKYENPVRKINIADNSLFNKFQLGLKPGVGFHIESKKDRKSIFFQINGQYFPTNILNIINYDSYHDTFESKKFQSTIVSGEILIGIKF